MNKDVTILMTSCNEYEDILKIHDILFRKNWSDCPFNKVLVVDEIKGGMDTSLYNQVIQAGFNAGGGGYNGIRIREGLKNIDSPYVILLQEDFLLYTSVDTQLINRLVELAKKYNVGNLRFTIDPPTQSIFSEEDNLLEYIPGMAYRCSMQAGLWNKKYLNDIFCQCNNGSEFERVGSFISAKYPEPILGWRGCAYPYFNAIQRGKWWPYCINMVKYNGIEPDLTKHPIMTNKDRFLGEFKGYILSINPKLVVKCQNLFNLGKKY